MDSAIVHRSADSRQRERRILHSTKALALLPRLREQASPQEHRNYLDLTFTICCEREEGKIENVKGEDGGGNEGGSEDGTSGYQMYVVVSIYEDYDTLHEDLRAIFELKGSPNDTCIESVVRGVECLFEGESFNQVRRSLCFMK